MPKITALPWKIVDNRVVDTSERLWITDAIGELGIAKIDNVNPFRPLTQEDFDNAKYIVDSANACAKLGPNAVDEVSLLLQLEQWTNALFTNQLPPDITPKLAVDKIRDFLSFLKDVRVARQVPSKKPTPPNNDPEPPAPMVA